MGSCAGYVATVTLRATDARRLRKARLTMDVILHVGAHRTGSTRFQTYMTDHSPAFEGQGIGFWGPSRTRRGLLHGLAERPTNAKTAKRAVGRVRLNLSIAARSGLKALVVSDENMLGSCRRNLRARALYPELGERMARIITAFQPPRRVVLQIRSPEAWWAATLSYLLPRGGGIPDVAALQQITQSPRSWRQVITDLACACPETDILIAPYERFGPSPDRLCMAMTGQDHAPAPAVGGNWTISRPDLPRLRAALVARGDDAASLPAGEGRWHPFTPDQAARLRETYADDLFWLRAGADGLARLTENPVPDMLATSPAAGHDERGLSHDGSARRLAQTR